MTCTVISFEKNNTFERGKIAYAYEEGGERGSTGLNVAGAEKPKKSSIIL